MDREEARSLGLPRYNTGEPCKNGHGSERFTRCGACVVCTQERNRKKNAALTPEQRAERRKKQQTWRNANVIRIREKQRIRSLGRYAWDKKHAATRRRSSKNFRLNNPLKSLLINAKCRARTEGVPFDITVNDIVQSTHCPVFGHELIYGGSKTDDHKRFASLDRIIPSIGYVKGNVRVISQQANLLKSNHTLETLELIRRYIDESLQYTQSGRARRVIHV